jgi:hypothetical protein
VEEELGEGLGVDDLDLRKAGREGDDHEGPADGETLLRIDLIRRGGVGSALQPVVVELQRFERETIGSFPIKKRGLIRVVVEVGEAVKSAGVAHGVPDGTFEKDGLTDSGKEAADGVPVGGEDVAEGWVDAVSEVVLDVGVVAGAAITGGSEDGSGLFFTDGFAPELEAAVVLGVGKDGGDRVAVAAGSGVDALAGYRVRLSEELVAREGGDCELRRACR